MQLLLLCQVREFGIGSTNNPLLDIFFLIITCLLDIVLILIVRKKIFFGHSWKEKGKGGWALNHSHCKLMNIYL